MLKLLLFRYRSVFIPFNLLGYITFRSAMAALTALVLGIIIGPMVINRLRQLKIGQQIRGKGIPDLYEKHKGKAGTPTMGGILIVISTVFAIILWGDWTNRFLWISFLSLLGFGFIGAWDDYLKLMQKGYKGLSMRKKLLFQSGIALLLGIYIMIFPLNQLHNTAIQFPFFKNLLPQLGALYLFFIIIVLVGSSNAVNLTDGLDGLAIGCTVFATSTFALLAYVIGRVDYCAYLKILHVQGSWEITVFLGALIGASLAFLWYNSHPAEVFMGDTGSLSLGGVLGTIAVCLKQEFLLLIIGGIFVMEALSVIIQVTSFKITGRRVFRMAPIHHHFEMKGWPEAKIITRFWIISGILGLIGLATLKMR